MSGSVGHAAQMSCHALALERSGCIMACCGQRTSLSSAPTAPGATNATVEKLEKRSSTPAPLRPLAALVASLVNATAAAAAAATHHWTAAVRGSSPAAGM